MWNLKYGRNEPIHETEIDSQTQIKLVIAGGEGERGTGSLGLVDANLQIELVSNKVLLYCSGNCIQYTVINHNRI